MLIPRLAHVLVPGTSPGHPAGAADQGCQWWNLACQGSTQIVDSGMSAITRSTASGTSALLGEIVKTIDESTAVPLADPGYREIYYGFLGLAAPLVAVLLCGALVVSGVRRDAATLGRAVVGLVLAGVGGALYIVLAQLLVALDDWLSHGIVRVTGQDLREAITEMAAGFESVAGVQGEIAANMLMIVLMLIMLLAGLLLWFVLVLRKVAILVVVAFAPLIIAGYLWAPTRAWVRRATEVLIALVFTKSAIYALFGIGLALLSRGTAQSLSDFVGTVVLLCGACFTPLLMLRLVHFAGETNLAGEMIGNLRGGVQPVLNRMPHPAHSPPGRHEMARQQAQAPGPQQATPEPAVAGRLSTGTASVGAGGAGGAGGSAAGGSAGTSAAGGAGTSSAGAGGAGGSAAGGSAGTSATGGAGKAAAGAGPLGAAVAGAAVAGQAAVATGHAAANQATHAASAADNSTSYAHAPAQTQGGQTHDPVLRGPAAEQPAPPPSHGPGGKP